MHVARSYSLLALADLVVGQRSESGLPLSLRELAVVL